MFVRKTGPAAALLAGLCWGGAAASADLTLSIDGVRSDAGWAMIAVYDRADAFEKREGAAATVRIRARKGRISLTLDGLPAGRYAVVAFHDEDGDGALDANLLGIPSEGFGFSRGARGFMGPPAFADAAVTVGADDVSTTVPIDYLWGEE